MLHDEDVLELEVELGAFSADEWFGLLADLVKRLGVGGLARDEGDRVELEGDVVLV
jgi:hypothetical protein